jgi:WD40 repeat protein
MRALNLRKPLVALGILAAMVCGFFFAMKTVLLGKPRVIITGQRFYSVAFSPNSKLIAAGEHDGHIIIRETTDGANWFDLKGQPVADFDFNFGIVLFAFSPNGTSLAWAAGDGTVTVFDLNCKQVTRVFPPHETRIIALGFTSNSAALVSVSRAGVIRLIDLDNGKTQIILDVAHTKYYKPIVASQQISRATIDNHGKSLALRISEHIVFLDLSQLGQIRELAHAVAWDGHGTLGVSPDGRTAATRGPDKVRFFDCMTGAELGAIPLKQAGVEGQVRFLAFSPDGHALAVGLTRGENEPSDLSIWDLEQKVQVARFACHDGPLTEVAWSPDGKTIATASDDLNGSTVKLWDVESIHKRRRK